MIFVVSPSITSTSRGSLLTSLDRVRAKGDGSTSLNLTMRFSALDIIFCAKTTISPSRIESPRSFTARDTTFTRSSPGMISGMPLTGIMEIVSGVSAIFFPLKNLCLSSKDNSIERNLCKESAGIIFIYICRSRPRPGQRFGIFTFVFVILNIPKMKVPKLIQSIEELVKLADKEFYYRENNLQLRFSSQDSVFVIGTREDGTVYLS